MVFSTPLFVLVFLPVALAGYYLLAGRESLRKAWLAAASTVFYGWWDPRLVPLLVGSITVNWLIARAFSRSRRPGWLSLGVALDLALLAFFKYADFLATSLLALIGRPPTELGIVLPLGISFFTFQQISYLVDLRRGTGRDYGYLDWFLYVAFFPQLIAGPIVRHDEIIAQFRLDPRRPDTWESLGRGAVLFVIGLAKKALVADSLATLSDPLYARALAGGTLGVDQAWAAAALFTLQVYFDFSGYSDMAVGMGRMCGLSLPINFDAPYRSASVAEFWRRWHTTLSRFLRDYLYIPLGGSRHGAGRQALAILGTMVLGGLWHGAGWTYAAWGTYHGAGLAVNALWQRCVPWRMPRLLGWILTLGFLTVSMVPIRAPAFGPTLAILGAMAGAHPPAGLEAGVVPWLFAGWAVALLGPTSQSVALARVAPRLAVAVATAAGLVYLVLLMAEGAHPEFIYFQF